jgi:peptide-methionine (R)-S-oxide reductase
MEKIKKTEKDWEKELSPDLFNIAREKGTEPPFTGKYLDYHGNGKFLCAACGNELFDAKAKFPSGTGWPSFYEPISNESVEELEDRSHGMTRTEVSCNRCGAHLGHVFEDGPKPTGLRYCMNSISLRLANSDST